MDQCPICHRRIEGEPRHCPECGAPLRDDPAELERAEQAVDTPPGPGGRPRFGRFCLAVAMVLSMIHAFAAVVFAIYLWALGPWGVALSLVVGPAGFVLCVAQFLVFRKVHQLYDFTPGVKVNGR